MNSMTNPVTVDDQRDANELVRTLLHYEKTNAGEGAMELYRRFADAVDDGSSPYTFTFETEDERRLFESAVETFVTDYPDAAETLEQYLED